MSKGIVTLKDSDNINYTVITKTNGEAYLGGIFLDTKSVSISGADEQVSVAAYGAGNHGTEARVKAKTSLWGKRGEDSGIVEKGYIATPKESGSQPIGFVNMGDASIKDQQGQKAYETGFMFKDGTSPKLQAEAVKAHTGYVKENSSHLRSKLVVTTLSTLKYTEKAATSFCEKHKISEKESVDKVKAEFIAVQTAKIGALEGADFIKLSLPPKNVTETFLARALEEDNSGRFKIAGSALIEEGREVDLYYQIFGGDIDSGSTSSSSSSTSSSSTSSEMLGTSTSYSSDALEVLHS